MSKETKSDRLGMRISPQQKERWTEAAKADGFKSLAAWINSVIEEKLEAEAK